MLNIPEHAEPIEAREVKPWEDVIENIKTVGFMLFAAVFSIAFWVALYRGITTVVRFLW